MQQNYVLGFLFSPDQQKAVFIKKTHPEWQAGKFNGVGGGIQGDESPYAAMIREFHEETGVRITTWENYLVLEGGPYKLFVFRAFSHHFQRVESTTDEKVTISLIRNIYLLPDKFIRNLGWMVPLALDPDLQIPMNIFDLNINHSQAAAKP